MHIFYFSGTGNSKLTAEWIAETARQNNEPVKIYNIAKIEKAQISELTDSSEKFVFISPAHGFNFPPIMVNFLLKFPKGKNSVILMSTRAGMKIGNWVTPGVSGVALYFASIIMWLKGYKMQALYGIDLPSNWISLHPGLTNKTIDYITDKVREKVRRSAEEIIAGKRSYWTLTEIIQDSIVTPISIGYYFAGRFILSKTYIASSDCDNCGVCIKNCPVNAIKLIDNRPYWTYHCESCMKCVGECPNKAIETAHGFLIGINVLYFALFAGIIYTLLSSIDIYLPNNMLGFLVESIISLPIIFLAYRINHYLMKFKFYQNLVVFTSLSKYKFWGRRYKARKYSKAANI